MRKWRLHGTFPPYDDDLVLMCRSDLLNPSASSKDEVQNREAPPASTSGDDGGFALSEEEARELAELLDD